MANSELKLEKLGYCALGRPSIAILRTIGAFPPDVPPAPAVAHGTFDESTTRSLQRGAGPTTDAEYRADLSEILRLLAEEAAFGPPPQPWLLSSSTARAALELPITFAHDIRPDNTASAFDQP
ncbi:hypothetical protein [Streptomyces nigra]|uniref:hypothetical protein n=1 Tax=Streptomyces nigra TaxID=1827580 RepID=UPI0037F9EBF3